MQKKSHLTADESDVKKVQWTVGGHLAECYVVNSEFLHSQHVHG